MIAIKDFTDVTYKTESGVGIITINRPDRYNALRGRTVDELLAAFKYAWVDQEVGAVILTGAGEKAFVSGADISQFEDMRAAQEAVKKYEHMAETALMSIYNFPKPTLACIQGFCIGGGVNVAISCDMRIAASNAVFSVPAAKLGLGYRYSAMKNLVDLIGPGAAKDLFFTARKIDAQEALHLGLITRVCAIDKLPELLLEYTSALAANAPITIGAAKAITREILKPSTELDMALCQQLIRQCFDSADYAEGRKAFMEKRKPVFKGR